MEVLDHSSAPTTNHPGELWMRAQANGTPVPAFPLARLTTCGRLTIEVLQAIQTHEEGHQEAVYGPPDAALLARKGSSTAFILLAILASQPECFASKDWLAEKLGHGRSLENDEEEGEGLKRVDNVVSRLRFLLLPAQAHEQPEIQQVRRHLVAYQRASGESGPGYRLAGMPLVWVDVTEIEAHVKRARRLEQFGEDGLSEWQAAYDLAMRGSFLPEEIYSDWAQWRRQRVETHLWECVQALWRRAAEQGKAGETEAIRILREYWHSHQTNEDALRPLLELLGKHECFGEAQTCYDQLCAALIEEGKQPDQRTRDIIEFLQAVQLQRKRITVDIVKEPSHLLTAPPLNNAPHDWFPEGHEERGESSFSFFSLPQTDSDILSRFVTTLNHLPIVREKEVSYFDQQTRLYWYAREETALSAATLCSSVLKHIDALTLLLSRSHSPTLRLYLCEIACRTVLLAGILHYDMGQYTKARHYYHAAFQAATEANNPMLQAIVWGWVSFTWTYAKCYTEALHCIQWARRCATQTADIMVQAWLGAIEAEIQAHLQNREACVRALDRIEQGMACSPSQDTSYLFEFHPVLLLGYKGVCLQQFYQRSVPATHSLLQEAQQSLELALASEAPPKRKLYYLNDLAGIYARQGEAEKACASILQTIPAIKRMGSGSKTLQSHVLQAHALLQPYRTTAVVRALDEQMAALLSG